MSAFLTNYLPICLATKITDKALFVKFIHLAHVGSYVHTRIHTYLLHNIPTGLVYMWEREGNQLERGSLRHSFF